MKEIIEKILAVYMPIFFMWAYAILGCICLIGMTVLIMKAIL